MPLRADAEEQDVERGHRAVVFRPGRRAQQCRVAGGCRLRVVAVRPVGAGHGVHPRRVDVHVVEQGRAGARFVPLLVPGRQEPLISPPDVDMAPVHGVPGRRGGKLGEHRGADATAGKHERRGAPRRHGINEPRHQPGGDSPGQQRRIPVDNDFRCAHRPAISSSVSTPVCPWSGSRACSPAGQPGAGEGPLPAGSPPDGPLSCWPASVPPS